MAPEQKALFSSQDPSVALRRVDHRADVFALGIVIREMVAQFGGPGPLGSRFPELERVLDRATRSDPAERFSSASELASALEGCRELADIARCLPPAGPIARLTLTKPWLAVTLFTILPQVLGSAVNITYNGMRIVSRLTPQQQEIFRSVLLPYNGVIYPICIWLFVRSLRPVIRGLGDSTIDGTGLRELRRRALGLPLSITLCTTLGWIPGALFFPGYIQWRSGALPGAVFGHFAVSFTLSWLIALAYSFLFTQYAAVRVFYPRLCEAKAGIRREARRELKSLGPGMRFIHFSAGFVPLLGAAFVVAVGPESLDTASYDTFRLLVALLILTGMTGLLFALRATGFLAQTLVALTGPDAGATREDSRDG